MVIDLHCIADPAAAAVWTATSDDVGKYGAMMSNQHKVHDW